MIRAVHGSGSVATRLGARLKSRNGRVFKGKAGWRGATKEHTLQGSVTEEQRSQAAFSRRGSWEAILALLLIVSTRVLAAQPADPRPAFDKAALLYEEGHYPEAIALYEGLRTNGVVTASVLFNEGNAWLKLGRIGRAIAAYRQGRSLEPRDAEIAANLHLARSKVSGAASPPGGAWAFALDGLTPNEWAGLALVLNLLTGLVLVARQLFPRLRPKTASATWILCAAALGVLCAAIAAGMLARRPAAVVVSETTARFGPLLESEAAFNLPDGAELRLTDRKGDWWEVADMSGRSGWVEGTNLATFNGMP